MTTDIGIETPGPLVLIGGGEDREEEAAVLREFVRLAGGAGARLLVIAVASERQAALANVYTELFRRLGAAEAWPLGISHRERANSQVAEEAVARATGVFFTGGSQLRITRLLGNTLLDRALHRRHQAGLVLGGTSAGAAMMSNSMIIGGGSDESPRFEGVQLAPGMDLIVGAIIDTHFSQRGRHGRLLTAVAHYPQDLGVGIDENTAAVINAVEMTVVGEGAVTVIDGGGMTHTSLPYVKKGDSLTLHDVRVHVLSSGAKFDLANRRPVVDDARAKEGRSSDDGRGGAAEVKKSREAGGAKKKAGGKGR